jgi:hypothetical protein
MQGSKLNEYKEARAKDFYKLRKNEFETARQALLENTLPQIQIMKDQTSLSLDFLPRGKINKIDDFQDIIKAEHEITQIEAISSLMKGLAESYNAILAEIILKIAGEEIKIAPITQSFLPQIEYLKNCFADLHNQIIEGVKKYLDKISENIVKRYNRYHIIQFKLHIAISLQQKINHRLDSFLTDLERYNLPEDFSTNKADIEPIINIKKKLIIELASCINEFSSSILFGLFKNLWKSPSEDSFARCMLSYYGLKCSIEAIPQLFRMDDKVARQLQNDIQNIILNFKRLHEDYPEYILDICLGKSFDLEKVNIDELNSLYELLTVIMEQSTRVECQFDEQLLRIAASNNVNTLPFPKHIRTLEDLLIKAKFVKRVNNETLLKIAREYQNFARLIFCNEKCSEYLQKISINEIFGIYFRGSNPVDGSLKPNFEDLLTSKQNEIILEKLSTSDIILLTISSHKIAEVILNYNKLAEKLNSEQIEIICNYRSNALYAIPNLETRWNQYLSTSKNLTFQNKLTDLLQIKNEKNVSTQYELLHSTRDSTFFSLYAKQYEELDDFYKSIKVTICKLFTDEIEEIKIKLQAAQELEKADCSEKPLAQLTSLLQQVKIGYLLEAAKTYLDPDAQEVVSEITSLQEIADKISINIGRIVAERINIEIKNELQAADQLENTACSAQNLNDITNSLSQLRVKINYLWNAANTLDDSGRQIANNVIATLKAKADIIKRNIIGYLNSAIRSELDTIKELQQTDVSEESLKRIANYLPNLNDHIQILKRYISENEINENQVNITRLEESHRTMELELKVNCYPEYLKQIRDNIVNNAQQTIGTKDISAFKLPAIFKSLQSEKDTFPQSHIQTVNLKECVESIYQRTAKEWRQLKIELYVGILLTAISAALPFLLLWTVPWIKRKIQEQHKSFVYVELPASEWNMMKALRPIIRQSITTQNADQTPQLFNNQNEFKKHIIQENGKTKVFMNSEQKVRFDILRAAAKKYSPQSITPAEKNDIRFKLNNSKRRSEKETRDEYNATMNDITMNSK